MIHIEIETDNIAFACDAGVEAGRILHDLAGRLICHSIVLDNSREDAWPLFDCHGNRVGRVWEVQS